MASEKLEKASSRMPHDIEAERAVIGYLLLNGDSVDEIFATISSDMFYDFLNRAVFHSIGALAYEGEAADAITTRDEAKTRVRNVIKVKESNKAFFRKSATEMVNGIRVKANELDGVTEDSLTDDYFAELLDNAAYATNIESYCKIIREKYILRQSIEKANEIIDKCRSEEMTADAICNEAQEDFYKLSSTNKDKSYVRAYELVAKVFEDLDKAAKSVNGITGIKTGFSSLDHVTAGLQRTDMIVLAGRPGHGKTTFALNLAVNMCADSGYNVAFFSLEMTNKQLVKKVLADLSGVSSTDMRSGRVSERGMNDLFIAAKRIDKKNFFLEDNSYLTIADLRNKCLKIKRQENGLDIVFIDYLQLMHAGTNYRNSGNSKNGFASRQEEIAEISRNIKALAKELDVPIVALSQVSREVENRKDQVPQLSDIRESGAIEQDADIIMFLSRSNKENEDDVTNLNIAKHRNGSTGVLSFKFDKATSKFSDWDNKTNVPL